MLVLGNALLCFVGRKNYVKIRFARLEIVLCFVGRKNYVKNRFARFGNRLVKGK